MKLSALYPGTFDPITLGHEDLVRRAARLFDRVVVAIARDTGGKVPMFTFEERVDLAEDALGGIRERRGDRLQRPDGRLRAKNDLQVIVRGLRAVSDFEYEFQLANMNRHLTDEVETTYLTPTEKFTFISSSLVREVASLGGDVSEFVSPEVKQALLERCGRA